MKVIVLEMSYYQIRRKIILLRKREKKHLSYWLQGLSYLPEVLSGGKLEVPLRMDLQDCCFKEL